MQINPPIHLCREGGICANEQTFFFLNAADTNWSRRRKKLYLHSFPTAQLKSHYFCWRQTFVGACLRQSVDPEEFENTSNCSLNHALEGLTASVLPGRETQTRNTLSLSNPLLLNCWCVSCQHILIRSHFWPKLVQPVSLFPELNLALIWMWFWRELQQKKFWPTKPVSSRHMQLTHFSCSVCPPGVLLKRVPFTREEILKESLRNQFLRWGILSL